MNKIDDLAACLAVVAIILAASIAIVKYISHGELDSTLIAAGFVIPAIVLSVVSTRKYDKQ